MKKRCSWCGTDPLYMAYHDDDWGVPLHDDRKLFEMLVLEGAQAGLSWLTVLRKRENYRTAFNAFDAKKIAGYGKTETERLLADPGIIRNRLKIESAIRNARGFLAAQEEFGTFNQFIWRYVDYSPRQNSWKSLENVPTHTRESDMMSKDLKKRGFKFVGSTICYAFMQGAGVVNDHLTSCFRYDEINKLAMD